jgi:hypothetical protein
MRRTDERGPAQRGTARRRAWVGGLLFGVLAATGAGAAASGGSEGPAAQEHARLHGTIGLRPLPARVAAYSSAGMVGTPRAVCGPGDRPETSWMGRVPLVDYVDGRALAGYTCNARDVAHEGQTGGYATWRYVDRAGHVCAFYDGTLTFPVNEASGKPSGVVVLDMSNPARPRRTALLSTPAMRTPHESLRLNARRGLLVAVAGGSTTQVGEVDVYDVSHDCRNPTLDALSPMGVLGHEGAFSPDGRTYWATATATGGLSAIDLTDPTKPVLLMHSATIAAHGLSVSDDGNRLYLADVRDYGEEITEGGGGLRVLDASGIQSRTALTTDLPQVGYLSWPEVTIPQSTIPVTIRRHRYLIEFDEFDSNVMAYSSDENVGGVRLIDIQDDRHPRVVSRMRLSVWERDYRATDQRGDPGAAKGTQGYAAHYCAVPQRAEPGIVACSTIASGLRVFDIRNPLRPREVAYAVHPGVDLSSPSSSTGAYAMSAAAFDVRRRQVWYTDGATGFWVEQLTAAGWPE